MGGNVDILTQFKERARQSNLSVVLPEGKDARIIAAARVLKDEGIARPIVLGKAEQITQAAEEAGVEIDDITTVNPRTSDRLDAYAAKYHEGRDDLEPRVARRMVMKPLFYGGIMVAAGDAHAMVAGAVNATATVIQAGVLAIGFTPGIATPSSFFLMVVPDFQGRGDTSFIFADCAVNIDPSAEELAEIAIASALSGQKLLGEEARVALLSFSTCGSASHDHIDKVTRALEIAKERRPDMAIDGEFQADAAIIPRVAATKVKRESAVAGVANVLIFPDLDAGNIAYKLTQYMAGATAIGPFLQGFARPISDLSRGASVDDIVSTAAITLAQV
jgi:phosphate acetyltransferase